jgi:hypothetical protein
MDIPERPKRRAKPARPKAPPHASRSRVCKFCQANFIPKKSWQKFCSLKHKDAYWNIERILNNGN